MKEIKLTIDGKEIALTAAQIEALGIDVNDGCVCDRADDGGSFYYVGLSSKVEKINDSRGAFSNMLFKSGNYFRSESYAKQFALHQNLSNLLRRYSEQHGGACEWDGVHNHFPIGFDFKEKKFYVGSSHSKQCGAVYFGSQRVAEKAIEEVVKPFMAEHPDFVW